MENGSKKMVEGGNDAEAEDCKLILEMRAVVLAPS